MTRPTERWSGWLLQWFAENQGTLRAAARELGLTGARSPMAGESMSVLLCLLSYADQTTLEAYPAQATIADETELAQRTVRRCLVTLEEAGWIRSGARAVTGRRGRPPLSYQLTLPGLEEAAAELRSDQAPVGNSTAEAISAPISAPICAPISAPYGAQNLNQNKNLKEPPPDSYASDAVASSEEADRALADKLARVHLAECPPAQPPGAALLGRKRAELLELLEIARGELPGADQEQLESWCLDRSAQALGMTRRLLRAELCCGLVTPLCTCSTEQREQAQRDADAAELAERAAREAELEQLEQMAAEREQADRAATEQRAPRELRQRLKEEGLHREAAQLILGLITAEQARHELMQAKW